MKIVKSCSLFLWIKPQQHLSLNVEHEGDNNNNLLSEIHSESLSFVCFSGKDEHLHLKLLLKTTVWEIN